MSLVISLHAWDGISGALGDTAFRVTVTLGWVTVTLTRQTVEALLGQLDGEIDKLKQDKLDLSVLAIAQDTETAALRERLALWRVRVSSVPAMIAMHELAPHDTAFLTRAADELSALYDLMNEERAS